jgi:hypothetical protein
MLRSKIGSFYLVQKLGCGSVSEAFLAVDPRTREKRVFKIFGKCASIRSSPPARFLRETDIIRRLSHPGIIKIFDIGIVENRCYYAMEFVPKGDLKRMMARGRIPLKTASELFAGMCEAVAHVHSRGVIHRNLKPSNVLINPDGSPVVSDFSIARAVRPERTLVKQVLGAIAYQAPEQRFTSQKPSQREDVYALGAIFYEMLMGFPPLGKFPWPVDVQPDFPEALQSVLQKCLALEPGRRFEHASRLRSELAKCEGLACGEKSTPASGFAGNGFEPAKGADSFQMKTDRIEAWFGVLRAGTARERLTTVRQMIDKIEPAEAKAILKLYSEEEDRVRWGLIRVLGELKIQAATPLILNDLRNPFHTENALEALGKIGSDEAYNEIRKYVVEHPENAVNALIPLARTGKQRSVRNLRRYLRHENPALRQAAVRALGAVACEESLRALKKHLCDEEDEGVRCSLFEAVNSLQSVLLPQTLGMTVHTSAAAVRSRNSELPA